MAWDQVIDSITNDAATYQGPAKLVQFTFSGAPEQLDVINSWLVSNFLSSLQTQATANNGSKVLKLRLWRDTSPTWRTDYFGELEITTPPGFEMPFLVAAIIIAAVAAISYYLVIKPMLNQAIDIFYGPKDPSGNRPAIPWGTIAIVAVVALVLVPDLMGNKK